MNRSLDDQPTPSPERDAAPDSPGQDATSERVLDALPPPRGRAFAQTWWGRRWLGALEDTALDARQLRLGRARARAGAVGAVSVRPGRVTAVVRDRDGTGHRSDVLLQRLDEADWDRLLQVAAAEAGHLAALLDGELPPRLVEDAAAAGVELLPGIGDLEAECACGAWDHCPHSAALSYQVARLLDQDPFLLLLMRGRGEADLLAELAERASAGHPDPPGGPGDRGVEGADGVGGSAVGGGVGDAPAGDPADAVYAAEAAHPAGATPSAAPEPPPPVDRPGPVPTLGGGTAPAPGLDVAALEFLAADAVRRAHRLLTEALSACHPTSPPPAHLTVWEDAVRLAAHDPGPDLAAHLADGCGRTTAELRPAVAAWACGGPDALAVLEDRWAATPEELERAAERIAVAWPEDEERPRLRASGNRWTVLGAAAQLRCGPGGRWWPYRRERGRWWPAGPAEGDPAAALAPLLRDDAADPDA